MITDHMVLSDRYEVEELLGQGGMARVYRGMDRVLERPVAVKVLTDDLASDPLFVERFRREAQAAAGLNHPSVVSVYDTGSDDGVHYIVMEYVEGRTLGQVLRSEGAFPPERALDVTASVCAALDAAHRKGIVHRDVKPGNVMFTGQGAVKVMDFGIARAASGDTLTKTATVMGTATYFSPEQARGEVVDARSDLYSLGVVLYEMLAGTPPFRGETSVAVAYQHVREAPPPLDEAVPGIDPGISAVVMAALEKDPGRRYQTAEAMSKDLARVRAGRPPLLPDAAGAATGAMTASGAETTQVIAPEKTAIFPSVPAESGQPAPPLSVAPSTRRVVVPPAAVPRRRRWWPAVVVLGMVLLGLGLVGWLLATGLNRGAIAPGSSASSPTSPTASTSAPTTPAPTQGPPSVANVLQSLQSAIADGVAAGEVSKKAADQLSHGIEDAVKAYQNGDLEGALGRLADLDKHLGDLVQHGEITSPDRAAIIHMGIVQLGDAMAAAPPSPAPGGGQGNENGNGKGKGGD
jgi:serine/threonine protein kinase